MATVAGLVETLSQALEVPRTDVHHRARWLREAGMLPSEGRGRGAPHVSASDAAKLIVAVLATTTATDSPEAVTRIDKQGRSIHAALQDMRFQLVPRTTFVGAVSYLIERLSDQGTHAKWRDTVQRVGVTASGDQEPYGWIEYSEPPVRATYGEAGVRSVLRGGLRVTRSGQIIVASRALEGGLKRESSIGVQPFMAIALLLANEKGEGE